MVYRYGRYFMVLIFIINLGERLPIFNVITLLNFIVNLYLLIDSESMNKVFNHEGIFIELLVSLGLRIRYGYNGIEYFRIEKDRMIMLIIPSLFPEAYDLPELFFSIILNSVIDFESLSDFFLQSINSFKGLRLFNFLAIP